MKIFTPLLLSAALFLSLPAHSSSPRARFAPAQTVTTGDGYIASAIAAQDLNNDGKIDIVVANSCVNQNDCAHGSVSVLLGNGDGTFKAPVVYLSGDGSATSLAIADVNHDGISDLVVANACADSLCNTSSVGVLIGTGTGTFKDAVTYPSLIRTSAIAVADMDGDGDPDLVVGSGIFNTVGVMLNNGAGKFAAPVTFSTGQPAPGVSSIAIADLDGDHKLDVVVANCDPRTFDVGSLAVLMGNGDGTLQAATNYSSGGSQPISVVLQDVNGDGKLDLVAANLCTGSPGGACSPSTVAVLSGNGNGTFAAVVNYPSGGRRASSIATEDMNGDGIPDIVAMNGGNRKLGIVLGGGNGTFQKTAGYSLGGSVSTVADLDGDGRPDVISGDNSEIDVLMNITIAPTKTSLATSGSPSHLNQPVTFTATVSSVDGDIPDGESVNFFDGNTMIGTGSISGGVATFTTSSLSIGTHTVHAKYPGHAFFKASAGAVKQVVTQ